MPSEQWRTMKGRAFPPPTTDAALPREGLSRPVFSGSPQPKRLDSTRLDSTPPLPVGSLLLVWHQITTGGKHLVLPPSPSPSPSPAPFQTINALPLARDSVGPSVPPSPLTQHSWLSCYCFYILPFMQGGQEGGLRWALPAPPLSTGPKFLREPV